MCRPINFGSILISGVKNNIQQYRTPRKQAFSDPVLLFTPPTDHRLAQHRLCHRRTRSLRGKLKAETQRALSVSNVDLSHRAGRNSWHISLSTRSRPSQPNKKEEAISTVLHLLELVNADKNVHCVPEIM